MSKRERLLTKYLLGDTNRSSQVTAVKDRTYLVAAKVWSLDPNTKELTAYWPDADGDCKLRSSLVAFPVLSRANVHLAASFTPLQLAAEKDCLFLAKDPVIKPRSIAVQAVRHRSTLMTTPPNANLHAFLV